jgi:hypothetical protein
MSSEEAPDESERPRATYLDARGRRTADPARAVGGEITDYGNHDRRLRRSRFFLDRTELPWLPFGEAAFLLWVLLALFLIWVSIGLVLRFT